MYFILVYGKKIICVESVERALMKKTKEDGVVITNDIEIRRRHD